MKYFERICKSCSHENDEVKAEYLRIVHVLSKLTYLYSVQLNSCESKTGDGGELLDINKLQQTLTSIQLSLNRTQRLSHKVYVDLTESKQLTQELQRMEQ
eukprot:CAMPEP_0197052456 /NCGR_PEP_ID=MMETSP1384-20130603/26939_1 /TAXON_ID=29189 /ORGANISM="Ammonia sp." /LENGTH=99 /DNA_ID=CAMNT_0042485195 /DNA_START=89 /DNA_END=385 /DNA_ORIENTATION=-